jgi:hypothetical protein
MVALSGIEKTGERRAAGAPPAPPAPAAHLTRTNWTKRLLGEPLLHFLILGIVLFGAFAILRDPAETVDQSSRIELTADDLRQLAVMWLAQGRPLPSPDEMRQLVDQKVTEEILAREAISLGLDRDDQIIKRRLAQKMDFLLADLAALEPPTAGELAAWYAANGERFALPPHASFRHLYFSFDRHGERTREAAADALTRVVGLPPDTPELASIADPFMFRNYYGDATPEQMAKEFGPAFAAALFELKPGSWQGPIQSGYGWHLVWVDSNEPGRVPDLAEVEPDVRATWFDDRYLEIKDRAFAEMRSRYEIVVPPIEDVDLENLAAPAGAGIGSE